MGFFVYGLSYGLSFFLLSKVDLYIFYLKYPYPPYPIPKYGKTPSNPIFWENIPSRNPKKWKTLKKLENGNMENWENVKKCKIGKTCKNDQKKEGPKTMLEMTAAKF